MNFETGLLSPIHKNGCSLVAQGEREAAGLHILKAKPPLPIPTRAGMVLVPQYPFDDAIEKVQDFFAEQKQRNAQFSNERVAWVTDRKKDFSYYPPAFESRGLSLKNMLFLESPNPTKTLHSVCDAGQFQAVVVVGAPTRTALQIAKKWLKPRGGEGREVKAPLVDPDAAYKWVCEEGRRRGNAEIASLSTAGQPRDGPDVRKANDLIGQQHQRLILFIE